MRALQLALQNLIPQRVLDVNSVFARRRRLQKAEVPPPEDAGLRWLTAADAERLAAANGTDPAIIRRRLEEGHRAVIAEHGGRIVGVTWCVPGDYLNGWLHVKLPPHCIWKSDIWVAHDHRGRRLAGKIQAFTDQGNVERGFVYNYSFSDALNRAARSYGNRQGSELVDRFFYVRLFDLTLIRFRGAFHLGRWSDSHPFVIDFSETL